MGWEEEIGFFFLLSLFSALLGWSCETYLGLLAELRSTIYRRTDERAREICGTHMGMVRTDLRW